MMNEKSNETIYECWQDNKLVYYCNTGKGALNWLSLNGGGTYKNTLHKFQMFVKPNDYKNII